jgi:hypothetical protein
MHDPGCPHLIRETISYRESLDLSRAAPTRVTVNWFCGHPFHGIRLDLGDAPAAVEERCADCALPVPGEAAVRKPRRMSSSPRPREHELK